jgi:long-chain fatty acid transport protein
VQRWKTIFFTLILSATTNAAHAGGFATGRYAGEHGHVATDHPTAIYFNPAGLALGLGWRIYAEGVLAWRTLDYERPEGAISNVIEGEGEQGTPSGDVDVNSGKGSLSDVLASPFLGVVTDLGVPNLGVGLAFYVPFGGQSTWDKNDDFEGDQMYPGAEDGVQRWSVISGEIRSLYGTLAGAYRFPGLRLAIGAGFSVIQSNVYTVRARNVQGTDDVISATGGIAEGRSLIDVSGTHIAASAGVNWEAMPGLWIAASYTSQPGFGNSTQSGTLTNKFGTGPAEENDIRFEQELPDTVRLGARYSVTPELELRLSADYQRWSVLEHQCLLAADVEDNARCELNEDGSYAEGQDPAEIIVNIPRQWDDTFGVRAGASYWLVPELEVNGGVNYDTSAVPDKTADPSLIDADKIIALAGVRWAALPDQLLLALTVNNVFYFKRTVDPREDGDIGTVTPSTVPDGAGTYEQNVLFVNLGAEYRF